MSTPFLNQVKHQIVFNRRLVYKFFVDFSLFEYALKQAGFLRLNNEAEADWDRFAQTINSRFDTNATRVLHAAVRYLLDNPPKKQFNNAGVLVFRDTSKPPGYNDSQWLAVLIRRVRNNLFHGGKFDFDPVRDTHLLNHSLTVLETWSQLDENVERAFRNVG